MESTQKLNYSHIYLEELHTFQIFNALMRACPAVCLTAKTHDGVFSLFRDGNFRREHQCFSPAHYLPISFLRIFTTEWRVACSPKEKFEFRVRKFISHNKASSIFLYFKYSVAKLNLFAVF